MMLAKTEEESLCWNSNIDDDIMSYIMILELCGKKGLVFFSLVFGRRTHPLAVAWSAVFDNFHFLWWVSNVQTNFFPTVLVAL